ncbi:MAG: S1 RNA-binding domain-containing protein [Pirellulaceae bacterium]|nr:S1 RNA-binding domain-containing protein [Pirellulaceae bacterium]
MMTMDPSQLPADMQSLPIRDESSSADRPDGDGQTLTDQANSGNTEGGTSAASESGGPLSGAVERRKIQVGSRPAGEDSRRTAQPRSETRHGKKPRDSRPSPRREKESDKTSDEGLAVPAISSPKVPPPSRRDKLPPELEQALDSAMAGASMDELLGVTGTVSGETLEVDSKHRATVVKIHGDNVFCSLDGRNEAVVSLRQFPEPPELGAQLDVVIRSFHPDDGLYEVAVQGGAIDVHDWSDLVEGAVVEARITGSNTGGLECTVGGIRGFIPVSQIELFRVEELTEYHEKKLPCVVTEANPRRRNLVLSHRALLEREREEQRRKLLEELDSGQVREGVVSSVRDFGVFVDLGGVDGLVHVSQLSWDHINHPSEVLQAGQRVRVKVEKVNRDTGKISLSYRDLLAHPWTDAEERFQVNSTVKGTVTRIAKFGAFVKIAPGIEGLIHISELAHHRVMQVSSVVREGEEVEVKVVSVDQENQRIGLSLKAAHPLSEVAAEAEAEPEETAEEAAAREPSVKPFQGPLRGGTDRTTGGEDFGLRW